MINEGDLQIIADHEKLGDKFQSVIPRASWLRCVRI